MQAPVVQVLSETTVSLFSSRSRSVFALGQLYSQRLGVIHMEHLVFALADMHTRIFSRVLEAKGLNRGSLAQHLQEFDVTSESTVLPDLTFPLRLSSHVKAAVEGANSARASRGGKQIRTRDLL